ncbi:MAG TPA: DUF488 domain-containing protein [Methylocella sp.]|nr:DUF488 domain-containing protein [Methylocella sp.]
MAQSEPLTVLTIGHSTHPYERFLEMLRMAGVTAVADVRTAPYSRHFPQFNSDALKGELGLDGIAYSFLGKELGGRPKGRQFYCDGVADYEKMAGTEEFRQGLDRVVEGAKKYRIALMCSEHDPLDCHRCLLVGRALAKRGASVKHMLPDGEIIEHAVIEDRLLKISGRENVDMFAPREERLAAAYRERARKVAFAEPKFDPKGPVAAE